VLATKDCEKKVLERATLMFLHSFLYKNERAAQEFCETTPLHCTRFFFVRRQFQKKHTERMENGTHKNLM
jgi:hypothetical protein